MNAITRGRIIFFGVLLLVIAAFVAMYHFYVAERLRSYKADIAQMRSIASKLDDISQTFEGYDTQGAIQLWEAKITPWQDALDRRTRYFTLGDWRDHEEYPENAEDSLRFWYNDTVSATARKFYSEIREEYPSFDLNLMPDLPTALNIQNAEIFGTDIEEKDVNKELARLAFGMNTVRLLLDNKATWIKGLSLWPEAKKDSQTQLVKQTVGLAFTMPIDDLTKFLESLRTADRYYSVDAIKVFYPYVGYNKEPQLDVEMLLTQARYEGGSSPGSGAQGTSPMGMGGGMMGGADGMNPMGGLMGFGFGPMGGFGNTTAEPPPQPSMLQKTWKWIKRNVFVMSG